MTNDMVTAREHRVTLTDGAVLVGDWYDAPAVPRGTVVVRTPYAAALHRGIGVSFVQRGWNCLVQDVRGRHRSTGDWVPYQHEGSDGLATLAAVTAEAPGLLVPFGASYAAHAALEAARLADQDGGLPVAGVVALVPALGLWETAHDATGVPQYRHRFGWWAQHGFTRVNEPPLSSERLDQAAQLADRWGAVLAARRLGWHGRRLDLWRRLWRTTSLDLPGRYGTSRVPLLTVTGDTDFFDAHARRLADAWGSARQTPVQLLSGPWGHDLGRTSSDPRLHASFEKTGSIGTMINGWLNRLERGEVAGRTETRLEIPAGRWTELPLSSGGAA